MISEDGDRGGGAFPRAVSRVHAIKEAFLLYIIRHAIQYQYKSPVFLEPLLLRLRPRSDVFQRLMSFDLDVAPRPAGRSDNVGLEGNCSTSLWFDGNCEQLSMLSTSRVETLLSNPFAFIVTAEGAARTPAAYPEAMRKLLEPYLQRIDLGSGLDALAADVIRESGGQTVPFLCSLAAQISGSFSKVVRPSGEPQRPSVTLARAEGACRDLTLLFMDICRSVGLAARFVSGYTDTYRAADSGELHAWAEVYLPGGGWRGFDPTLGLAVADRHVAVAASAAPIGAAPMAGTFRGESASAMTYSVSVQALPMENSGELQEACCRG